MENNDALGHMIECQQFCQASADNTERMLQFVLATIQQRLETVPYILDSFVQSGKGSPYAFAFKGDGLVFVRANKATIFEAATLAKRDADKLLEVFLTVPGLGLVKAGFACQLFAGLVGCLDTHNVTLYGLPANALRFSKKLQPATQARKRAEYISLCNTLGGPVNLWARWCDHKGAIDPKNWDKGGWSVSKLHIECLTNDYQHNILAFMDSDDTRSYET